MTYRSAILAAIEDLKDHQTGSSASSIRRRIKEHDMEFTAAAAVADSDDDDDTTACWNETLFQSSLKNLVARGTLVQANGSNYKFSDEYLEKRADALRERAESMEERRRLLRVNNAASSPSTHHAQQSREEPPKGADLPKKKTVHAKVKLTEGPIVTVVNPLDIIRRGDGCDEMETDDEEGGEVSMDGNERSSSSSSRRHQHLKIIPRMKVGVRSKKMM